MIEVAAACQGGSSPPPFRCGMGKIRFFNPEKIRKNLERAFLLMGFRLDKIPINLAVTLADGKNQRTLIFELPAECLFEICPNLIKNKGSVCLTDV